MNNKMQRFLSSINIENIDNFDIDFELVSLNKENNKQVDMIIIKDTPWKYSLYEEFHNAISSIRYPYTMSFTYKTKPNVNDAIEFFSHWHTTVARFKMEYNAIEENGKLIFLFASKEMEDKCFSVVDEYRYLLDFLGYKIVIETRVVDKIEPQKEEPVIENKSVNEVKENKPETKKIEASISEDNSDKDKSFEEAVLMDMKANLIRMEKERKNRELWKRGGYKYIEDWSEIKEDSGNIDINGEIYFDPEKDKARVNHFEKMTRKCGIGKGDYAFPLMLIENRSVPATLIEKLKNGQNVRVFGHVDKDKYTGDLKILVHKMEYIDEQINRFDNSEEKRVELHLHSRYSNMDGAGDIANYVKMAKHFGHKAIAITDHGVVHGFHEAQSAVKGSGIKMIYGSELYALDEEVQFGINPIDTKLKDITFIAFDLETTGLSKRYDRITEFAGVKFKNGEVIDRLDILINPERDIPLRIQQKTHIYQNMVSSCPKFSEVSEKIREFCRDSVLISHNLRFDIEHLNESMKRAGKPLVNNSCLDTLPLSRYLFPESKRHTLEALSKHLGLDVYNQEEAHRANADAEFLKSVWISIESKLFSTVGENITHKDVCNFKLPYDAILRLRPFHVTALATNFKGIHNLYEIISLSHIKYFNGVAKTPRSIISSLRENILIGSACLNGEIFEIAKNGTEEQLINAMKFYDFIEVQPVENYAILLKKGDCDSYDDVKRVIKDIVDAAKKAGKTVVATGDCHYVNPEDKKIRDVYIEAEGVGKVSHPLHLYSSGIARADIPNPDQHFRTTDEMLESLSFLGADVAKEIVITNTNKIADMTEEVTPINEDESKLNKPELPGSEDDVRNVTFEHAKAIYGDPLPKDLEERLNTELNGLLSRGYGVTYYIAKQIIDRAHERGYLVGSRGSVGSSFVATMYGVTEVNPLKPHYVCPKCKHFEYYEGNEYASGFDLPDKACPECGAKMHGDGHNIPFQTFLGFHGEKIPDIDLNFPSDYQQQAFDHTQEIFGKENCYRAGTISKVKVDTAMGYVRGFYERTNQDPTKISHAYKEYYANKVAGTERTTGQHAGGMIILPKGMSIYDFTPIQYPANNEDARFLTSHLDWHSINNSLLKLDLLGQGNPLVLNRMCRLAGKDIKDIPMNDKEVISLFNSPKALKMNSNILEQETGAIALPEFGTTTTREILKETRPSSYAELVIISALSHGEMVWGHNAEDLIKNKICTLKEVIGCRDDIMTYLLSKGVPNEIAFRTMEDVRKGKKVKEEYAKVLRENAVPEWYINSCNKIRYMFPKAHACAYTTEAVRMAYFKLYYPLVFYAVWFSVQCKQYDIKTLLKGFDAIVEQYKNFESRKNKRGEGKLSPKENAIFEGLEVFIEFYERGFHIENIDLYKSEASDFVIDYEKKALIPPFKVLDGLGDAAATSVVEGRKGKEFISKEDLLNRTGLTKTNVADLDELGVLKGLGDTNQMSLFDFGLGI